MKDYKIAVAGTGYVGLSIATLFLQHHQVTAVDIIPEKMNLISNCKSPIPDDYIENYLAEKDLNLAATLDSKAAIVMRTLLQLQPLRMSTSNFQWRYDGLRWRIKRMQNTPAASLFYCRARDGHDTFIFPKN